VSGVKRSERWATAVVCGAGMAGLLSARVLADRFERVVVVERDALPDSPISRRGVPQAPHIHTLLPGGRQVVDELLPGVVDDVVAAGGLRVCLTSTMKRYLGGGWLPRFESDIWTVVCTRTLIEAVVREHVRRIRGVEFWTGCRPVGVMAARDGTVSGVRVAGRSSGQSTALPAGLVVDALGRSSPAPQWLADLGGEPPEETVVQAFWGYASRFYRMPPDWDPGWVTLILLPTGRDGDTRGAMMQRQEGDRWICTLVGCAGDYPPSVADDVPAFAASLPVSDVADALAAGVPISELKVWRRLDNRLRAFDRLDSHPDGLLVTGDGVCALNPVYAQGMSVAALAAADLRTELIEQATQPGLRDLAARFQRRLAHTVFLPWSLATGADYAVPGVQAPSMSPQQRDFLRRWDAVNVMAKTDIDIARLRFETTTLLRSADWMDEGDIAEQLTR
jgi:2-polyprenyl-6-methoxyphenol hydroxylase-like FAD-dependent oxidoreductase